MATRPALTRRSLLRGGLQDEAARVRVDGSCLARAGIVCQSCRDACPEAAVRFRPALGRVAVPEIDDERCIGCGACVAACPADALELVGVAG